MPQIDVTDSYNRHQCSFCSLRYLFPDGPRPLGRLFLSKNVSHRFSAILVHARMSALIFHVILIVAETTCVSFCAPWIAFSLLPFNADWCPFAFRWCSCLDSFISGLKISGSDLLTVASNCHGLQFSGSPMANYVVQYLDRLLPNTVWS